MIIEVIIPFRVNHTSDEHKIPGNTLIVVEEGTLPNVETCPGEMICTPAPVYG